MSASTVSWTCAKQRVCVPSPKTVSGWPLTAWRAKRGSTIPYLPVWRGPTVLNRRTTMFSAPSSWW